MRKAVITGAGAPLKVVEANIPDVPKHGALIRTLYGGVCHSDLHFIQDEMDLGRGQVFRNRDILGDKFAGITPGHEICGVVEKIGDNAKTNILSVGDKVCVYPWIGCQECSNCKLGCNNMCLNGQGGTLDIGQGQFGGGYGSYVAVPKLDYLVKIPENIPMQVACMLPCSAATAYCSLVRARGIINQALEARGKSTILIIGAGGLGLWCTQLVKKVLYPENVKVIVADISEDKRNAAVEAGADKVVIWDKGMTELQMAAKVIGDKEPEPVDVVINFVGSPSTAEVGLMVLDFGGMQVVLGLFGGLLGVSLPGMVSRSLSLVALRTSSVQGLREVVKLVSEKGLGYPKLKFFSLDEINVALEALEAGKIEGRALIKYE